MWKTFAYYYTYYAMAVLSSRTSGNKILYTRYYNAEIGGDSSRTCKMCVCKLRDLHMFYNFWCKKPNQCTCIFCCKQPVFFKNRRVKIVLRVYNVHFSLPVHIPLPESHVLSVLKCLSLSNVATVLPLQQHILQRRKSFDITINKLILLAVCSSSKNIPLHS